MPPQRDPQGYGAPRDRMPYQAEQPHDGGRLGGGGVPDMPRSPGMQRNYEKMPMSPRGGPPVTLRVSKVEDKNLQTQLIYSNTYVPSTPDVPRFV
jgi:hypothetical protein